MISKSMNWFVVLLAAAAFFAVVLAPMLVLAPILNLVYLNLAVLFPFIFIIFYLLFVLYSFLFMLESFIILKVLFNPKHKEGVYSTNSMNPAVVYYALDEVLMRMCEKLFSMALIPHAIYSEIIFQAFGLKKGKRLHLNAVKDPYLTEIGTDSLIGQNVLLLCHSIVRDVIVLKRVKIGKNVTIGANTIVSPGAVVEDNVIIGANSFVPQNMRLEKDSFYAGCPARLIRKLVFD